MIRFRQKAGTIRLGVFAGAIASVMAISGLGASSASAAPFCTPNEVNVVGKGSILQKNAQEIWTGRELPVNPPDKKFEELPFAAGTNTGYKEACPAANNPTVSYGGTGEEAALAALRLVGAGVIDTRISFIGTEAPPNAAQIANAEAATMGAKPVIVPVSQTSIAVIVNPPANCDVTKISSKDLSKVFAGEITNWSELEVANRAETVANACKSHISRIVPSEATGVTYQFKNYLATLAADGMAGLACKTEGVLTTWTQLREIGANGKPNTSWPECEGENKGTPAKPTPGGDSGVANHVAATAGTIGFAGLPSAKTATAKTVEVQNGKVLGTNTYAKPDGAGSTANCKSVVYEVPIDARWSEETSKGIGVDWSAVFGSNPTIGGTNYPICTLTYIVAWDRYGKAGYGGGSASIAEVISDYVLHYVVSTAAGDGQSDIEGTWYAALPKSNGVTANKNNVQDAAEFAAGKIGVKCEEKSGGRFTSESDCYATKDIEPGKGSWERIYH